MVNLALACAVALALILLRAAWGDLRARDIPNWIPIAIAALAPLWWLGTGIAPWPALAVQVGVAALVFAILAGMWNFGLMGGGDVKLLAALALWFAPLPFVGLLTVMAVAGGIVTVLTLIHHRIRKPQGAPEVPYGVAIAVAGLWSVANQFLTISVR